MSLSKLLIPLKSQGGGMIWSRQLIDTGSWRKHQRRSVSSILRTIHRHAIQGNSSNRFHVNNKNVCCADKHDSSSCLIGQHCISHNINCFLKRRQGQSIQEYTTETEAKLSSVSIDNIFSDANKKRTRERLHTMKPLRFVDTANVKKRVSAVLVPLCLVGGEPSILFTLRSSSLRKHRGEVSFPGGNQDEADVDVVHTALRETFEELGLNPRHFDIWGHLQPDSDSRGKLVVYPVLARYTKELDISSLKLCPDEVEEAFTCRIQDLCDLTNVGSTQFRTGMGFTLPVYLGGPHRVWGLTAIILHRVLTLLAPGLYKFKLRHIA